MTRYLAVLLLLAAAGVVGCSSTTETKIEYDTTYVHDSIKVAMVRFVSLMPDNSAINLKLTNSVDAKIYATTGSATAAGYLPFIPDSSKWLFFYNGSTFLDSFQVAGTQVLKGSISTFGLYQGPNGILVNGGDNNDSAKLGRVPAGFAMVRFINGNPWVGGSQQTVNLDTEAVTQTGVWSSGFGQSPGQYVALPAGTHKLIASSHGQPLDAVAARVDRFDAGLFYTIRLIGDEQRPAQLLVDPE